MWIDTYNIYIIFICAYMEFLNFHLNVEWCSANFIEFNLNQNKARGNNIEL